MSLAGDPVQMGAGTLDKGGGLYSEVHLIIGNGTMGYPTPVCRMADRHYWKHYLPSTSLAGGNNIDCIKLEASGQCIFL